MRTLLLLLAVAQVGAHPTIHGTRHRRILAPHQNFSQEVFELTNFPNNITEDSTPFSELPGSIPAPIISFYGSDPTGAGGKSTLTTTATGSPTSVKFPFTPDGDFSSTTNWSSGIRIPANAYYATGSATATGASLTDFSIVVISRLRNDATNTIGVPLCFGEEINGVTGCAINSGTNKYIYLQLSKNNGGFWVLRSAAGQSTAPTVSMGRAGITVYGLTVDDTAHTGQTYFNGYKDTTGAAIPAGPFTGATNKLIVGQRDTGVSLDWNSDIYFIGIWDTKLTDAQHKAIAARFSGFTETAQNWSMCRDNTCGLIASAWTSSIGGIAGRAGISTSCWQGGQWETFTPLFNPVGCQGPTTSFPTISGPTSVADIQQRLQYTRLLSNAVWQAIATPVITCTATPNVFRDGRAMCSVQDNSNGQVEGIYQNIDISALNTSDKIYVGGFAIANAAAQHLDLQVVEQPGGETTNYTKVTVGTSMTPFNWTHTVVNGANTSADFRFVPGDHATANDQETVFFVANASFASFNSGTQVFATYQEEENVSTIAASYNHTNRQFVMDAAPLDLSVPTQWSIRINQLVSTVPGTQVIFQEVDSASLANSQVRLEIDSSSRFQVVSVSPAGATTTWGPSAAVSFNAGDAADTLLELTMTYGTPATVKLKVNGALVINDSSQNATAPASLNYHFIAGRCTSLAAGACDVTDDHFVGIIRRFTIRQ